MRNILWNGEPVSSTARLIGAVVILENLREPILLTLTRDLRTSVKGIPPIEVVRPATVHHRLATDIRRIMVHLKISDHLLIEGNLITMDHHHIKVHPTFTAHLRIRVHLTITARRLIVVHQ